MRIRPAISLDEKYCPRGQNILDLPLFTADGTNSEEFGCDS